MTKYDDIKKAVFSVEHKADPYAENDITTIVQDYKELLGELRTTMNIITDAIKGVNSDIKELVSDLNKLDKIKDQTKRGTTKDKQVKIFASKLDVFNTKFNYELQIFPIKLRRLKQLNTSITSYPEFESTPSKDQFNHAIANFKGEVEHILDSTKTLLENIDEWPALNIEFNKSKRKCELALIEFIKGLLAYVEE